MVDSSVQLSIIRSKHYWKVVVERCTHYLASREHYHVKQVDILISENQALQILYLTHRVYNETTY